MKLVPLTPELSGASTQDMNYTALFGYYCLI